MRNLLQRLLGAAARPQPGAADRRTYRPKLETLEGRECPTGTLSPPAAVTCSVEDITQATLTWGDVLGETGYRVLHWDGTQARTVATLDADTTTYTCTNLLPGRKQWLAVEAFNTEQHAQADWLELTTPADPITAAPSLTATGITNRRLTLVWGDATGETGYRVFRWDGKKPELIATVAADVTTLPVTGLAAGTLYHFYVESFNRSSSALTAWKSFRTLADPITAPTSFTAVAASKTSAVLRWGASTGETGYRVFRWDGTKSVLVKTVGANVTMTTVTGLMPGKLYWFYVQAFNRTNVATTAWKSAYTPPLHPLAAPRFLSAKPSGPRQVTLTWTDVPRAVGYNLYRWTGTTWVRVKTLPGDTTRFVVNGLTAGKSHWFIVQAYTEGQMEAKDSPKVTVKL